MAARIATLFELQPRPAPPSIIPMPRGLTAGLVMLALAALVYGLVKAVAWVFG